MPRHTLRPLGFRFLHCGKETVPRIEGVRVAQMRKIWKCERQEFQQHRQLGTRQGRFCLVACGALLLAAPGCAGGRSFAGGVLAAQQPSPTIASPGPSEFSDPAIRNAHLSQVPLPKVVRLPALTSAGTDQASRLATHSSDSLPGTSIGDMPYVGRPTPERRRDRWFSACSA